MFKNLDQNEKEVRFQTVISFAEKIENKKLRSVCLNILNSIDTICIDIFVCI